MQRTVHVRRLVVAAVEEDAVRVEPLVGKERERDLDRPRAPVDKVAVEEEQVRQRGRARQAEEMQQVVELA